MFNKISRLLVTVAGAIAGYCLGTLVYMLAASTYYGDPGPTLAKTIVPFCFAIGSGFFAYLLAPGFKNNINRMGDRVEKDIERVSVNVLLGGVIGLILGLIIAFFLSTLFKGIKTLYLGTALTALAYILLGSIGTIVGTGAARSKVKTKEDKGNSLLSFFWGRGKLPKQNYEAVPKILDTSVIIDGRIRELMKTGIMEGKIVIPEYVLTELRHLSDSADTLKKSKGRRGLEIIKEIQSYYGIEIYNTYSDDDWSGTEEVDVKLLKLAQKIGGKVVTNDYNLIQVAEIQNIAVLNINDVVEALRVVLIPGEILTLQVIKEGRENNQGVGYMEDGTMIVIEDGRKLIGKTITAEVTSVLQTASGRMIFAKPHK